MKILYVVSTLRQSGPTNQLLGIIKNLVKDKFTTKILTLSPEPANSAKQQFLDAGISIDSLDLNRVQFQIKGNWVLKKYIDQYDPDIVHTTGVRADFTLSRIKLKAKTQHCMTIRNYAYDDYIAKYGNVLGTLLAKNSVKAMTKCNYVICCSKTLKDLYQKILPHNQFYVIQNGVDTDKFIAASNIDKKISLRSLLKIPRDRIVFISVGSLIKRKDPLSIIKAFKNANLENKAILILLGDGALMDQCKDEADENIILKGNVANVNDYLQASDFYIAASKSEGLPNSVLEAGSCGLNLILSDIPQHREIFENSFEFIDLFEVGDVKALTKLIRNAIRMNNRDINYDIAEYIKNNFSNKVMSKKYENMYFLIQSEY